MAVAALGIGWVAAVAAAGSLHGPIAATRQAQSDLVNSVTAAQALFADSRSFPPTHALIVALESSNPALSYTAEPATFGAPPHHTVAVSTWTKDVVVMAAQGSAGRCWYIEANQAETGGPLPNGTHDAGTGRRTACPAAHLPAAVDHWDTSFPP